MRLPAAKKFIPCEEIEVEQENFAAFRRVSVVNLAIRPFSKNPWVCRIVFTIFYKLSAPLLLFRPVKRKFFG